MFPAFTVIASEQLLENFDFKEKFTNVSQNVAYALIEQNAAIVIDVRTKEEYAQEHIHGAFNIPLHELDKHLELLQLKDHNIPILLYCRSGRRSGMAGEFLERQGFKNVMNMGGVITWDYGFTQEKPTKSLLNAAKELKPLHSK